MPDTYQLVTDRIIEQLDKGIIPWKRGFAVNGPAMPTNFLTKKEYRGINILMLFCSRYSTNEWMTYKQAQGIGAQVRKGEKGTPIVFWSIKEKDAPSTDDERDTYAFCRTYTVFNVDQIDGITQALPFEPNKWEPIPAAQAIADRYLANGPALEHRGAQPCYSPARDLVLMPEHDKWFSGERYYKTLFHELAHSTGHSSRLDREFGRNFGNEPYAKEELIAEFSAAFLCASCGIQNEETEQNSVAYIQNWIAALKNDKRLAMSAAQKAQKAADLIQGKSFAAAIETEQAA